MTFHQVGPFILVATALVSALSIWNTWRLKYAYRARGRQMVDRLLTTRGETLVAINDVPLSSFHEKAGLSAAAAAIFEVHARTAEGDERTYRWAYAPRIFPWQTEGVQRLAHGIWIAA